MMRRFFAWSLLLITAFSTLVAWKKGYADEAIEWTANRFSSGKGTLEIDEIEQSTEVSILAARRRFGMPLMEPDKELDARLESLVSQTSSPDLDLLLANMEKELPQYLQIAAASFRCLSLEDLVGKMTLWQELPNPKFTHYAIAIRRSGMGLGWTGHIIAGERVEELTPEVLAHSKENQSFYSQCLHCDHAQSCQIPRGSRSIFIRCGNCHRVYSAMAADAAGRFRYVNEYLTGYYPPAHFPSKINRLNELMIIWKTVVRNCRYVTDEGENDAWQTALQTQSMGQGDCEDSSILLTDWLINRGFEARVALGRFAERGGHAWVVVRLDGQTYLLESTEGAKASRPPLLSDVGSRYTPDLLFDRESFYILKSTTSSKINDYWSENTWDKLTARPNPAISQVASVAPEKSKITNLPEIEVR